MRAFTIVSALIAVAVSGVLATPGEAVASLFPRQGSAIPDIPAQCQAKCASVQKITSCGTDLACMCTNEMGQGIVDCGNCGIDYHKNQPDINNYKAQFQASVNSYADSCTQAGHPVGPFSITGVTGSGGSSTTTGTGAGSTPTGSSANGALTFNAAAGSGALAAMAVVMTTLL
ncbi:hypothetical protein AG1IA_04729 [Rhizoctonia solani AG-1 IA]|uniref:Extracellular membrane protein CFEM domain-containing protein n=2 Tax=Rhizoctonia solani TaxID=456999 RepID=A0A8H7M593_9AGAM|nr:hypothetical protein AG1IA_04729 [Rhizoctonia solani AG-1 IA]KAF8674729.1 hypothetical protein RHS04_07068 [Rhizoctonia solani]KAF8752794.1 hypothetical protein RHS01_07225 [Rhizoctonia solani]CAE6365903.1 unnamed protein product [Rhizoctonia solani]